MNNKSPFISIIMPAYNAEVYIDEAIESIISQTYTEWELIIINDSSTDRTAAKVTAWQTKDSRITLINNTYSKGVSGALNSGLKKATGEYIARADADDINAPHRLKVQSDFLKKNQDIVVVGSWYKTFGLRQPRIHKHPTSSHWIEWKFISNTFFCHPSVMFKASLLNIISEYPSTAAEDFAFFSKIIHLQKGYNIPLPLVKYREHKKSVSHSNAEGLNTSVYETFLSNYKYYLGSQDDAEIFYNFHAKRDISFKNISIIFSKINIIGSKITTKYSLSYISRTIFYIKIFYQLATALSIHYIRLMCRGLKDKY